MKYLKIILLVLIVSCETGETVKDISSENQLKFKENTERIKSMLRAMSAEESDKFSQYFADSLKWSGPDKILIDDYETKEVLMAALDGYIAMYDNHELRDIKFFGGSTYSSEETSDNPNDIRVYGNWHHTHAETGKAVSHKWMALMRFNSDGQIYLFNDFFDVTGFLSQHLN